MKGMWCARMAVSEKKYSFNDLRIGMAVSVEQLSEIYNKYMIVAFDNMESRTGKLVFCGDVQDQEYDSWFLQTKPITPIYHDRDDLEDMAVYDE